jgi:hypothetical protein
MKCCAACFSVPGLASKESWFPIADIGLLKRYWFQNRLPCQVLSFKRRWKKRIVRKLADSLIRAVVKPIGLSTMPLYKEKNEEEKKDVLYA